MANTTFSFPAERLQAIGRRIRELREARTWGKAELAAKLGISAPAVGQIERGRYAPSLALFDRLSIVLNVTADWLLKGNEGSGAPGPVREEE